MVVKRRKKKKTGATIVRRRGRVFSVSRDDRPKGKTVVLVQRSNFTGFTPVDRKTFKRIKSITRGRTARSALRNALKARGVKKVEFA